MLISTLNTTTRGLDGHSYNFFFFMKTTSEFAKHYCGLRSQTAYASKELSWALPFLKAATMTHMMRCNKPQRKNKKEGTPDDFAWRL